MKLRSLLLVAALVAALVAPFSLMAQAPEEPESPWAGSVTLGYLATSGNTENSTLNTGFEVGYTKNKWEHLLRARAINASESNATTAQSHAISWRSKRSITDQDFLFGRLNWIEDRFGGFATQFSQTVGYGRHLINTDKHKLNAEIGGGARQSELQDGTSENETVLRAGLNYAWHFSETAEFRQDLTAEGGDLNTLVVSVTELSAQLVGDLALVASYTIKHNTDVPPLTEETDTYTALSLEYVF